MSPPMEEITTSTITSTATTGTHMLKIDSYNMIEKSHLVGNYIESPMFDAVGHTWRIHFYPYGKTIAHKGNSTVSIKLHGGATIVANIKFSMVGSWMPYSTCCKARFSSGYMTRSFKFIGSEQMRLSGYVKDDSFAIRCDITIVENAAVLDPVVAPADLERLGMVCKCKDELCKRHHVLGFQEAFCKLFFGCLVPK
uniref:MATH domain-containing protein n=1 Tax=Leersia perrieri TaxID=77586 RepID=A0A0D9XUE3_9ORYZ